MTDEEKELFTIYSAVALQGLVATAMGHTRDEIAATASIACEYAEEMMTERELFFAQLREDLADLDPAYIDPSYK